MGWIGVWVGLDGIGLGEELELVLGLDGVIDGFGLGLGEWGGIGIGFGWSLDGVELGLGCGWDVVDMG